MSTMKSKPRKSTSKEIEERVSEVADLLASGATKTQLHAMGREKWAIHWKTMDGYCARARERLLADLNRPKPELRLESFSFYQGIADDESQPGHTRVRARQRIDELLGLDAPKESKSEVTVAEPVTIQQDGDLTQERVDELLGWRFERMLAKQGPDALAAFVQRVEDQMESRKRFAPATAPKSGPPVEVTAATTRSDVPPPPATSTWTPPVREPGRSFDESTITPEPKKNRRNGGGGILGGLF